MKKLFVFLCCLFLMSGIFQPVDAWAGCNSGTRMVPGTGCDKMTAANAKKLAQLAWSTNDPSILRTGTSEIHGLAYYNDPSMAGCDNCTEGATDINLAYRNIYSAVCEKNYSIEAEVTACKNRYAEQVQNNIKETAHTSTVANANRDASINCMAAQAATRILGIVEAPMKGQIEGIKEGWNNGNGLFSKAGGAMLGGITGEFSETWNELRTGQNAQKMRDALANTGSSTYNTVSSAFYSFHDGCWFCPVFDTIYDVSNNLATDIYQTLRDYSLSLLMLIAFGWIMFHVLRFFVTLNAPSVGEFLTTFFRTMGAVMLAAIFLSPKVSFLTELFIDTPADFAIGLSDSILAASGFSKDGNVTRSEYSVNRLSDCPEQDLEVTEKQTQVQLCQPSDKAKYENKAMSRDLHDNFSCLIQKVSFELVDGLAISATIIVESFNAGGIRGWLGLPSLSLLIIGVLMLICYFYFYIRVPIYLIDLILRLAFLVIMLPIFVICYPFPSTRGYAKKGWEMLLSILVHMISLCVFICLALQLVLAIWDKE